MRLLPSEATQAGAVQRSKMTTPLGPAGGDTLRRRRLGGKRLIVVFLE
jgi:hypothetical protein